jgi:hypothetical protein
MHDQKVLEKPKNVSWNVLHNQDRLEFDKITYVGSCKQPMYVVQVVDAVDRALVYKRNFLFLFVCMFIC